jgi:hypothetical protein
VVRDVGLIQAIRIHDKDFAVNQPVKVSDLGTVR